VVVVRERTAGDVDAVTAFLAANHSARVARLGALLRPIEHPALLAEEDGALLGVLTYVIDGTDCEVLTLHTAEQWRGVGTALVERVAALARERGCTRMFLITTNDDVDALRFYQRRGFKLAALHPGAVDRSRATLKPAIPPVGDHGIPLRDELVLEREP
jgi:GNAT superfamily N-acetyltransferase